MDASSHMDRRSAGLTRGAAMTFVILLGLVSLFADMTYEGARSITGPYLAVLGASATVVGIVAGFGELIGYVLRLAAGYLSDRTGRYWTITLVGYVINLLAVPVLALAGRWEVAAVLMVAERVGKAIRTPARDAMLSHATTTMGRGWALDCTRPWTRSARSSARCSSLPCCSGAMATPPPSASYCSRHCWPSACSWRHACSIRTRVTSRSAPRRWRRRAFRGSS